MTRIAVIGDSHFDEHGRFDECVRLHDWIARDLEERDVDVVLHAGDLYERKSTPRERQAAAAWIQRVASRAPFCMVRGNHDALEDLPLLARLEARCPIVVEEAASVRIVGGVAVACLAWPRKAELLAAAGQVSREEAGALAAEAMRDILRGMGARLAQHDGPKVLLAHAMVRGSMTSVGQPLVGCDFELGLEDLALCRADAYLLGHIHLPQEWTIEGRPVLYTGSPRRTAFGEVEQKSYTVLDIDDAGIVEWERWPVPATPMVLLEGEFVDRMVVLPGDRIDEPHLVLHSGAENVSGAEVRLRYHVEVHVRDEARRHAEQLRADLMARGALSVKLEERVVAETRARAPEVARAVTLADKLDALWRSKGFDPGDRRARLLTKAHEVESSSAA